MGTEARRMGLTMDKRRGAGGRGRIGTGCPCLTRECGGGAPEWEKAPGSAPVAALQRGAVPRRAEALACQAPKTPGGSHPDGTASAASVRGRPAYGASTAGSASRLPCRAKASSQPRLFAGGMPARRGGLPSWVSRLTAVSRSARTSGGRLQWCSGRADSSAGPWQHDRYDEHDD